MGGYQQAGRVRPPYARVTSSGGAGVVDHVGTHVRRIPNYELRSPNNFQSPFQIIPNYFLVWSIIPTCAIMSLCLDHNRPFNRIASGAIALGP